MQYHIPKAEVDAVVQCKAGAIEKVCPCAADLVNVQGLSIKSRRDLAAYSTVSLTHTAVYEARRTNP